MTSGLTDSRLIAKLGASTVEEFALTSGKLDNVRVWFNNKVINFFNHT